MHWNDLDRRSGGLRMAEGELKRDRETKCVILAYSMALCCAPSISTEHLSRITLQSVVQNTEKYSTYCTQTVALTN